MLLISLLATVALVYLHIGFIATAPHQTITGKNDNLIAKKKKPLSNFVRITKPSLLPETAIHKPGVDLELTCRITGFPPPQIQWLKNGEPFGDVNEDLPVNPLSVATTESTIVISAPSPNPVDDYTCVGTSGDNEALKSCRVTTVRAENDEEFLQQLLDLPSKPRISVYYVAALARGFGSNVVLPCRVTSSVDAELYWVDNRDEVVLGNTKATVLPSGDLLIPDVQWSDMGNWICVVKNHYGKDSKSTFFYPAPT